MSALSITAANVVLVSGPVAQNQQAGEAFIAGANVYRAAGTTTWSKAQNDGSADEAGATDLGMALATADVAGARVSIALATAVVAVGTGTAGVAYVPGPTAGTYVPIADVVTSTQKVTLAALGIGSNQLLLCRVYNVGAAIP